MEKNHEDSAETFKQKQECFIPEGEELAIKAPIFRDKCWKFVIFHKEFWFFTFYSRKMWCQEHRHSFLRYFSFWVTQVFCIFFFLKNVKFSCEKLPSGLKWFCEVVKWKPTLEKPEVFPSTSFFFSNSACLYTNEGVSKC